MKPRSSFMLCSALSVAAVALTAAAVLNPRAAPAALASPGSSGAKATGGGHILKSPGDPGVHFGFNAQLKNKGTLGGSGVVQDQAAGVMIKILTVESFVSDGTNATFTGQAEFNGVAQQYQIDVADIDEPGRGFDLFEITTGTYTRSGILTGGNIQVQGATAATPTPTPSPTPDFAPPGSLKRARPKQKRTG